MKLTSLLLIVVLFQMHANEILSQKISLEMENATIKSVLNEIEQKTDFKFLYEKNVFQQDEIVSISVKKEKLSTVLGELFKDFNVSIVYFKKQIHIKANSTSALLKEEKTIEEILSQQQTITGKVTDKDGIPLLGVNILVKGTTTGVTTDFDGNYNISYSGEVSLVFSYLGMEEVEVIVNNRKIINVTMIESSSSLEEVVVVGYGSSKKSDLTGAVITVDEKTLSSKLNTNILQSLQGSAPGLSVQAGNFIPGEDPNILVRGVNSLSASNKPFVVLDGIPYEGDITSINPADVQSVSVLKDASSAAIYGARAANGVILITTKKGKGKLKINFDTYVGTSSMANKVDLVTGDKWEDMMIDFYYRKDLADDPNAQRRNIEDILFTNEIPQWKTGTITDWQDIIYRSALTQNYNLSLSGSTDNTSYYTSYGYLKQEGINLENEYKRFSIRVNVEHNFNDWLKIGTKTQFTNSDYGNITPSRVGALRIGPYGRLRDDEGNYVRYPQFPQVWNPSPFSNNGATKDDMSRRLVTNNYIEIKPAFIPGLSYKINTGYYITNDDFGSYYPSSTLSGQSVGGRAKIENGNDLRWTIENIIKYDKEFGNHHINFTGLYSREKFSKDDEVIIGKGFISDENLWHAMQAAENLEVFTDFKEKTFESIMARINYNYLNKYYVTATVRRDGSSVFGRNNKYGYFPSAALAWTISNEDFFINSSAFSKVDFLKLRLSWGRNGNQAINPYQTLDQFLAIKYIYGDGSNTQNGVVTTAEEDGASTGNPDLKWESNESLNIAFDFGLFSNRITGTVDYYIGKSNDLLMSRTIPIMNGYESILYNIGETKNRGFEFSLNSVNIQSDDWKWSTNINYQMTRDEITKLRGDGKDDISNEWFIGQPIDVYYDFNQIGVFQIGDDFTVQPDDVPGNPILQDFDNSGSITSDDRIVLGSQLPDWQAGITNTVSYKNWEFSAFINTVQGFKKLNDLINPNSWEFEKNTPYVNIDFWTTDNPSTTILAPSYSDLKVQKVNQYEDASFVRIQDVSLRYTFSQSTLDALKISSLQLYAKGNNLYTFTNWTGYDPETDDNTPSPLYPSTRTFVFGIKIGM